MFKAENCAVIYFNKFLGGTGGTWNLKQPIFKRLFQLDDSNFFYTKMGCFNKHPLQNGFLEFQESFGKKHRSLKLEMFQSMGKLYRPNRRLVTPKWWLFQSLVSSAFQVYSVVCQNQCCFCCFSSTGASESIPKKAKKKKQPAFYWIHTESLCPTKLC